MPAERTLRSHREPLKCAEAQAPWCRPCDNAAGARAGGLCVARAQRARVRGLWLQRVRPRQPPARPLCIKPAKDKILSEMCFWWTADSAPDSWKIGLLPEPKQAA